MSVAAIREKIMSFVEAAGINAPERLSHFIDIEQTSAGRWNDLPDKEKASVEETDAGDVSSYEDSRKHNFYRLRSAKNKLQIVDARDTRRNPSKSKY